MDKFNVPVLDVADLQCAAGALPVPESAGGARQAEPACPGAIVFYPYRGHAKCPPLIRPQWFW